VGRCRTAPACPPVAELRFRRTDELRSLINVMRDVEAKRNALCGGSMRAARRSIQTHRKRELST
jgi:hypothetical protein